MHIGAKPLGSKGFISEPSGSREQLWVALAHFGAV